MKTNILVLLILLFVSIVYAQFVDINAGITAVESSATAWGDIDNDGDLDLIVTGKTDASMFTANIYRNDGGGVFTNINAGLAGVLEGSASWGDYNRDGYLDLAISGQSGYGASITSIYRNNGDYTFTDINAGLPGTMYSSTAWGDFDNDGDLDLLITGANLIYVYRNNGNSTFTNINAGLTGVTYSASAWGDFDNDGDLDILATGVNIGTYYTKLYKNNGNSTFTEIATSMVNLGYGSISCGDYDNDGDLDVLLTGSGTDYSYTKVYRNDGNNVFTDISATLVNVGWGTASWGDYDNDGRLDILLEGHTGSSYVTRIYHNNGNGVFADISAGLINVSSGSTSWADYNNDGKLDFILTGSSTAGTKIAKIYRNDYSTVNNGPVAPANLRTYTEGSNVVFAWAPPWDDNTPPNGLSYQLRIGSTPGGSDILMPMSSGTGQQRIPQAGYANGNCRWKIPGSLLSAQSQYYWSVQAIDGGFAGSSFAAEAVYQKVHVLSPNGGETWFGNVDYTVHWTANPTVSQVNIYLSVNGSEYVQQNTTPVNAALGSFYFRMPNQAATSCNIKVENVTNTSEYDISDASFSLVTAPSPTIEVYQFMNTTIQVGKTYYFSFLAMNGVDNVKIQYSINGGVDWLTIVSSISAGIGTYYWTVPDTPGAICYLKVSDAANPSVYCWGNPAFSICKLELTSPNGGEYYQTSSVKQITFNASLLTTLKLQYSTDGGNAWTYITSSVNSTATPYNWTLPSTVSSNYLIRVSSVADNSIDDISNSVFTGAELNLTYPNASGIKLQSGKVYAITWSAQLLTGFIKLDYSTNGGSTYTPITWGLQASQGSYNWTVPANNSSNCRIRISSMDFPTFTYVSANAFTICSLALTSPNGSEVWGSQIVHNISWSYALVNNLKVEYSANNGETWNTIIADIPAVISGLNWTVPNTNSTTYKVRITDTAYPNITDTSDNNFTVRPQIILTAPNGGETLTIGSSSNVLWSATSDVANVNLDYSVNNGTDWLPVATAYAASGGTYNWTIPDNASTQCLVKVSNAEMSSAFDTSDASFIIPVIPPTAEFIANSTLGYEPMNVQFTDQSVAGSGTIASRLWSFGDGQTSTEQNPQHTYSEVGTYTVSLVVANSHDSTDTIIKTDYIHVLPSEITITFPNGGEEFSINSVVSVSWTATPDINNVDIDYSVNNGTTWLPIQTDYSTEIGTYDWTIPDNASTNCLVRVRNTANVATYDVSDSTFTIPIIPPSAMFVASPTSGYLPFAVQFEDQSSAGSGTLTNWMWYFGDGVTSTEQNPEHIYTTEGSYTVTLVVTNSYGATWPFTRFNYVNSMRSQVVVTAPNGGENLQINSIYPITWTATPNINNVDLQYSVNNGTDWLPIQSSVTANNGTYNWTVPDNASANCLVKITDSNDTNTSDVSDASFRIPVIPPTAEFIANATDGYLPLNIIFTDQSVTGSGFLTNWLWTFGDGNSSTEQNPTHLYQYEGYYTVTLVVTNSYDSTSTLTKTDYIHVHRSEIVVTFPNGGEELAIGSVCSISWTATADISNVNIEYSVNNGINWLPIQLSHPTSIGTYNWTIPDNASINCLVRVSDSANNLTYDVSDTPFTIPVILPTASFTADVTEGYEPLTVQFTDHSIAGSGTITSWLWNFGDGGISNEQNPQYLYTDEGLYSVSLTVTNSYDSTSTIIQSHYIHILNSELTLTAPNGGEILTVNSHYSINWTNTENIDTIHIFYSTHDGMDWTPIILAYPCISGTYDWTVPNNVSTDCRIRIIDAVHSSNVDTSDLPFTIRVIPPTAAFIADITEGYQPLGVDFADQSIAGTGTITSWLWNFGDGTTSTEQYPHHEYLAGLYTVTLTVTNSYDSTATFVRTDYIHVLPSVLTLDSPNGGETINSGTVYQISWTATPDIQNVKLDYSINGGSEWLTIAESVPASSGAFQWMVPNNPSSSCLVMISNAFDFAQSDFSNSTFTIPVVLPTADFTTSTTEGYEPLTVQFTDNSSAGSGNIISRLWNFGDGTTSSEQNPEHIYSEDGFYSVSLTVTNAYDSTNVITKTDYIHVLPSQVFLQSPNGGEILPAGSEFVIQFATTPNIGSVNLLYSINGGADWQPIANAVSAMDFLYIWTVPNNPSSNCLVKIVNADDLNLMDISDSPFTIPVVLPTADFTANTTEGLQPLTVDFTDLSIAGSGTLTNWLWNFGDGTTSADQNPTHMYVADGLYDVTLTVTNSYDSTMTVTKSNFIHVLPIIPPTADFSADMTSGFAPLSVSFTDHSVQGTGVLTDWLWNFGDGNTSTEQNPMHAYSADGLFTVTLTVKDSYDSTATIVRTDYIQVMPSVLTLVTPNGGEILNSNTVYPITWTATPDIAYLRIEYSVDNGTSWYVLATEQAASTGLYEWLVSNNPSSLCLVRISDIADSTTSDVSDTNFSIPVILPTVDFTADVTEAQQPLSVHFTDQSAPGSGVLTNWLWNFGDAYTSTEQNPTHIYPTEGFYTVTLTVTNSYDANAFITKTNYIHVLPNYPLVDMQMSEPMAFGQVYYGFSSEVKFITLQNTGTATLHVSSTDFHMSNSPFSIEGITLPVSVEPGNSTILQVRFTPHAVGSVTDTLYIHNDSTNEPLIAVPLSGNSAYVPPKAPENLTLEKDEHNINLYWDPVTSDIFDRPVEPDYYIVFYNDGSSPEGTFYYCGGAVDPFYIDMGVLWYAKTTLYRVRAFHTDGRRSLSKLPTFTKEMTEAEVLRAIAN